jgi:hypothetical protein
MVPLLYAAIQERRTSEPPKLVLEELAATTRASRARAGQQMADLDRILTAFDSSGIPAFVMKGFLLSGRLYGDVGLRESKDIDLLIRPQDRARACSLLLEDGFQPLGFDPSSAAQEWYLARHGTHLEFLHPVRGTNVELHWYLHQRPDSPVTSLFSSYRAPERQLPYADEISDLLAHGARHGWHRLKWLTDVWQAWERYDVDWEAWREEIIQLGLGPALRSAVLLREWILPDPPLPAVFDGAGTGSYRGTILARRACSDITGDPSKPPLVQRNAAQALVSGAVEVLAAPPAWRRLRINSGMLSLEDVSTAELTPRLYPLYPLLKPLWWSIRRLREYRRTTGPEHGPSTPRTSAPLPDPGGGVYRMFGLRVSSALQLPLQHASGGGDADINIRWGTDLGSRQSGGGYFLPLPATGSILVEDETSVSVETARGARPSDLLPFLLGSAAGAIVWRRGWIALHATAVRFDDSALLFAGPRGIGKSTLAAACIDLGAELLCDDLSPIAVNADGNPCIPGVGPRRIKLWPDAVQRFAARTELTGRVQPGLEKLEMRAAGIAEEESVRVETMICLTDDRHAPGMRRLRGANGLSALTANLYRVYLVPSEMRADVFHRIALLSQKLRIISVHRPEGLDAVSALAEQLASKPTELVQS